MSFQQSSLIPDLSDKSTSEVVLTQESYYIGKGFAAAPADADNSISEIIKVVGARPPNELFDETTGSLSELLGNSLSGIVDGTDSLEDDNILIAPDIVISEYDISDANAIVIESVILEDALNGALARTAVNQTLSANVSIGDTSITLNSAMEFPSSGGSIEIDGETLITYTGKAVNVLNGIPASGPGSIADAHVIGDTVWLTL